MAGQLCLRSPTRLLERHQQPPALVILPVAGNNPRWPRLRAVSTAKAKGVSHNLRDRVASPTYCAYGHVTAVEQEKISYVMYVDLSTGWLCCAPAAALIARMYVCASKRILLGSWLMMLAQ